MESRGASQRTTANDHYDTGVEVTKIAVNFDDIQKCIRGRRYYGRCETVEIIIK